MCYDNDIAWIDRENNQLSMNDISDRYLLNILNFLCRGGGYSYFLTEEKVEKLFNEATNRCLNHGYDYTNAINKLHFKVSVDNIKEMDFLLE